MAVKSNIAVITARKNSKRLPGKNLLKVGGVSLLERTISFAKSTGFHVIVSTDCPIMQRISLSNGVFCPWLRPKELSDDAAKSVDVVMHVLDWYEFNKGPVDNILLLQPTSPFRDIKYFTSAMKMIKSEVNVESLVSVSPMHGSVYWSFYIDNNNKLSPVIDLSSVNTRSQDLKKTYSLNGNLYLIKSKVLRLKKQFVTKNTVPIIMHERCFSIDIDDSFDYDVACMYALKYGL
ncbi:acylneuraminate cytidylyltransferase family protein [Alphaproteobacteria bacterium]|nr:acylneuraminate cytidylyltransferase family protein [Alphaproteobacteria bacterium]